MIQNKLAAILLCCAFNGTLCAQPNADTQVTDANGDALPQGAIARLGSNRFRHGSRVTSMTFSADGKFITSLADGWFHVWDARSGRPIRREYMRGIYTLASTDNTLLVARNGSDRLESWKFTDPRSKLPIVPVQPSGGAYDAVAVAQPQGDNTRVAHFTVSPDGRTLATATAGLLNVPRLIQLWRFDPTIPQDQRRPLDRQWTSKVAVERLVFSKDGRWLTVIPKRKSGPDAKTNVMVCGLESHEVFRLSVPEPAVLNSRGIAVSADARQLAVATSESTILVYDVQQETARPAMTIPKTDGNAATVLAFSPDGKRLASSGQAKTIHIWNLETGEVEKSIRASRSWIEHLQYSPDGKTLASAGQDGLIRLWDSEGNQVHPNRGHEYWVFGACLSSDGLVAATCSADGTTRIWDVDTGKQLRVLRSGQNHWAVSCRFSPDDLRLAVAEAHGVFVYDMKSGQRLWEDAFDKLVGSVSNSVTYSADGVRMSAVVGRDLVSVWEPRGRGKVGDFRASTMAPLGKLDDGGNGGKRARVHAREVETSCLSPDGKRLALGTKSRMAASTVVEIWDVDSGEQLQLLIPEKGGARQVRFSPDGTLLITAGHSSKQGWVDGNRNISSPELADSLVLWNVDNGQAIRKYPSPEAVTLDRRHVYGATFSPDGRYLVSAEGSGAVLIYETETGKLVRQINAHWGQVNAVDFSRDGKRLITASEDQTGLVWDFEQLVQQ